MARVCRPERPARRALVNALMVALVGAGFPFGGQLAAAAPVETQMPAVAELLAVTDPPILSQQAYLKASDVDASDNFGKSVALSGNTLVVGAPFEDSEGTGVGVTPNEAESNSGAAYVYVRTAGVWTQQAFLKASNTQDGDEFGVAVAISGDTIVVGADEEDSSATEVDGDQTDNLAFSSGAAYVFTRVGGVWTQQAYLKASNAEQADHFGLAVAVDGDTVVVGAHLENSNAVGVNQDGSNNDAADSGAAYIFVRNAGVWTEQAYVKASNTAFQDHFGSAVAVSGDTVVVGAPDEDSKATTVNGDQTNNEATQSGAAYVFVRSGTNWSQQAYLKASNTQVAGSADQFAASVAVSGETILVGAPSEDSSATGANGDEDDNSFGNAGAVYVFVRSGSNWTQQAYLKASNTGPGYQFGEFVGLDGNLALIGSSTEDSISVGINRPSLNEDALDAGAAYVYRRSGTTWTLTDYVKASNTDAGDLFGKATGVSGTTMVVGAVAEASNATGVNGNGADDSAAFAGSAYVFGDPCATAPFSDVATNQTFCAEIEWMKQSGISTGFNDGTYQPAAPVTRQAMSAFLARLAAATLTSCAVPPFSDVPTGHTFCTEIRWMKDNGISTGFTSGCGGFSPPCYLPGNVVTRQAMSAFVYRLNNLLNHF